MSLTQYVRLYRRFAGARPVQDRGVLDPIDDAKSKLGLTRPVELLSSSNIESPILYGLFRPRIVLPEAALSEMPPEQLRPVLLHELSHLKRRDLWVNWVQVALQSLYWFHPLVWFANARLRREREHVVDDMVLAHSGREQSAYSSSLLSVVRHAARRRMLASGYVGIFETRSKLARRIKRILDSNRKLSVSLGIVPAIGLIALALILIPQGRPEATPEEAQETDQAEVAEEDGTGAGAGTMQGTKASDSEIEPDEEEDGPSSPGQNSDGRKETPPDFQRFQTLEEIRLEEYQKGKISREEMVEKYTDFVERFPNSPLANKALFFAANLYTCWAYQEDTGDLEWKRGPARKLLRRIVERSPNLATSKVVFARGDLACLHPTADQKLQGRLKFYRWLRNLDQETYEATVRALKRNPRFEHQSKSELRERIDDYLAPVKKILAINMVGDAIYSENPLANLRMLEESFPGTRVSRLAGKARKEVKRTGFRTFSFDEFWAEAAAQPGTHKDLIGRYVFAKDSRYAGKPLEVVKEDEQLYVHLEGGRFALDKENDHYRFTTGDRVWNPDRTEKVLEWFGIRYDAERDQWYAGSPRDAEWRQYLTAIEPEASHGRLREVIVRDDPGPREEAGGGEDWLIDLDSGMLLGTPLDPDEMDAAERVDWLRQKSIDASGVKAPSGVLTLVDCKVAKLGIEELNELTYSVVRAALSDDGKLLKFQNQGGVSIIQVGGGKTYPSRIYAFQTREGGLGALQIVGVTDDAPKGVRVRYKVVKRPGATPLQGAERPQVLHEEEALRRLVESLSRGRIEDARRLFIWEDEFLSTFAGEDLKGTHSWLRGIYSKSLERLALQLDDATYLRPTESLSREPIQGRAGDSFGINALARAALARDNVRAIVGIQDKEIEIKMDAMVRVRKSWRLLSPIEVIGRVRSTRIRGFGPVLERVVNDESVLHGAAVDLDTGAILPIPPSVRRSGWNDETNLTWAENTGADLVGEAGIRGFVGYHAGFSQVSERAWEDPGALTGSLNEIQPAAQTTVSGVGELPLTYAFKTREGGKGILKLRGFTDDPPGVRIRYRMASEKKAPSLSDTGSDLLEELVGLSRAMERRFPSHHGPFDYPALYHVKSETAPVKWRMLNLGGGDGSETEVGWGASRLSAARADYYLPDGTPLESRWEPRRNGMFDIYVDVGRPLEDRERVKLILRAPVEPEQVETAGDGRQRRLRFYVDDESPRAIMVRLDRPLVPRDWTLSGAEVERTGSYTRLRWLLPPASEHTSHTVTYGASPAPAKESQQAAQDRPRGFRPRLLPHDPKTRKKRQTSGQTEQELKPTK